MILNKLFQIGVCIASEKFFELRDEAFNAEVSLLDMVEKLVQAINKVQNVVSRYAWVEKVATRR